MRANLTGVARKVAVAVALASCVAPALAYASVVPMSFEGLSRQASTVVVARVVSEESRAVSSADKTGRVPIVTDTRLVVERSLKGAPDSQLTLTVPGGTVGGLELAISDMPQFEVGERCLVFIDSQGAVVGASQGQFQVEGAEVPELGLSLDEVRSDIVVATSSGYRLTLGGGAMPQRAAEPTVAEPAAAASPAAAVLSAAGPSIASFSPDVANAGVGQQITIVGSGFGPGNGSVKFTKPGLSGTSLVNAAVVSWSDSAIVCVVPRYAESGPVVVTTSSLAETSAQFHVRFSTPGMKWTTLPVPVRINENFPGMTGEATTIRRAMDTWSTCGSGFSMSYAGPCTTADNDISNTSLDGFNDINVAPSSTFAPYQQYVLAWNSHWFSGNRIVEADIRFNDYFTWGEGSAYVEDLETVALHELGHSLTIDDQYDNHDKIMGSYTQTMHAPSADDIAGAVYLYGTGVPVDPTTPGVPTVSSATHPSQSGFSRKTTATFSYWATGSLGISAYAVAMDESPLTEPDTGSTVTSTTMTYNGLTHGDHWFHVRACSPEGEWGPTAHCRVRIDLQAPTSSTDASGTYAGAATIGISAIDANSGVASIAYGVDATPTTPFLGAITVTAPGEHTLRFSATDGVGNVEVARTATFTVTPKLTGATVERIGGATRYSVMKALAEKAFPGWTGVTHVVIASGEDRAAADPLSASGLAGAYGAPMLIVASGTSAGKATAEVESALSAIKAANGGSVRIHVVGGTGSVSSSVYTRLSALKGPAGTIERITGANRYSLAAAIAARVSATVGSSAVPGVLIANGENPAAFYDALAASPVAYATHRPLLLTAGASLRPETSAVLKSTFSGKPRIAVNSSAYLTSGVLGSLGTTQRMTTSSDRETASTQIANYAVSRGWLRNRTTAVTNRLPDALTGGSAMGVLDGPVLYTSANSLDAMTELYLVTWRAATDSALVIGGTSSVSDATMARVSTVLE